MKKNKTKSKINPLCGRCLRNCRQPASTILIDCPRYYPLPFKVEKHRCEQLGLFGKEES